MQKPAERIFDRESVVQKPAERIIKCESAVQKPAEVNIVCSSAVQKAAEPNIVCSWVVQKPAEPGIDCSSAVQKAAEPGIGCSSVVQDPAGRALRRDDRFLIVDHAGCDAEICSADCWIHSPAPFLLPVFRGKLVDFLEQARRQRKLELNDPLEPLRHPVLFEDLIDQLHRHDWVVYSKEPFADPEQHALPRRFVRIRYFGLLAHRTRKADLERARTLLKAQAPELATTESETWQEFLHRLTGSDPARCPRCGEGTLHRHHELPKDDFAPQRGPTATLRDPP